MNRPQRGVTSDATLAVSEISRRSVLAGPVVAAVTLLWALVATHQAGVALTDPDHVGARRLAMVCGLVALLVAIDIVLSAARRSGTAMPSRTAIRRVRVELLDAVSHRGGAQRARQLLRHLRVVPQPQERRSAAAAGRSLRPRAGELRARPVRRQRSADLLHAALGTGVSTQILAPVYVAFVFFLPLSLAVALVFSPDLQGGIYYATALSINWTIGAASPRRTSRPSPRCTARCCSPPPRRRT